MDLYGGHLRNYQVVHAQSRLSFGTGREIGNGGDSLQVAPRIPFLPAARSFSAVDSIQATKAHLDGV